MRAAGARLAATLTVALATTLATASCGASRSPVAVPAVEPGTQVTPTVSGLALIADAWPQPTVTGAWERLTDGVVDGEGFVVAPGSPLPHDFVFGFAAGRVQVAAVALWVPSGQELDVEVFVSGDGYPLVTETWLRFRDGAGPRGRTRVRGGSAPVLLELPAAEGVRRIWLALTPSVPGAAVLHEVSALDPAALAAVRAAGASVIALDAEARGGQDAAPEPETDSGPRPGPAATP